MTQPQNKIGALEAPPKSKQWLGFARSILTVLYVTLLVVCLLAAVTPTGMGVAAVYAAFAVTASYTLLMLLLWLYERFPPAS